MVEKYFYNNIFNELSFWGREDEDNSMVKLDFFSLSKMNFWAIMKRISTFIFWCMVIPLGPHSNYT